MADPLEVAKSVLEMAKSADGAWVTVNRNRTVEMLVRDGELEKLQESSGQGLSLELWVRQRYASHRTSDLRPDSLRNFVNNALALTAALEPDPDRFLPDSTLFSGRPMEDLQIQDPKVESLDPVQRRQICEAMDSAARGHERVISVSSGFTDISGQQVSISSNGFSGSRLATACAMSCDVTVRDEGDKRPEGSSWANVRFLENLPDATATGAEALEKALSRIGSRKGPSGPTTLVVDPRAGARLITALLASADARSFQQGRSMWRENEKKQLFPTWFNVTDLPSLPRGLGSRQFDGEGISAKTLPILVDGALQNLYVDTFYGRKIKRTPTTGSASNRIVHAGKRPLSALIGGSGIYVTSWLGGNSDATTGKFSLGLRGHRFEGGRIGEPVGEMNATGNLLDLFARLAEVGNDPWPHSATLCPTLVFEGVVVSGASAS